jgi:hypothetical protein
MAAAGLAVVLALPGGAPGGPSVVQAAALASRPALAPAPPRSDGSRLLTVAVDGVVYPYWGDRFAWETSGIREDRLGGRRAATVYYFRAGRRIGYTIVSGPALRPLGGARIAIRGGTTLRSFHRGARLVVTWLRGGHTCVLSGTGVSLDALLALAASRG